MSTVDHILTPEQLDAFRRSYSNAWMNEKAYASVAGSFLQAGPTEQLVIATWTTPRWPDAPHLGPARLPPPGTPINAVPSMPTELPPKERERVIIGLLTANPTSSMFLAIHVYWGLMEGLTPAEIGWVQLLTGAYEGIDKYSNGVGVLAQTLNAMAALYASDPTKIGSAEVFGALAASFCTVSQGMLAAFAKLNNLKMPGA
jgi:alkylhydroperoxidase/carboxymuconolactone decarboxylase family protein YurZ